MIRLENITAGYYENQQVLHNVNIKFEKGKFYSLLGPNGAGKSTLLKIVIGFLKPYRGKVFIKNQLLGQWEKKDLSRLIAIIPQHFNLQFDYKVKDLVLMGRFPYLKYWQNYTKKDKKIVEKVLSELDLEKLADKYFSNLSGGEKQRVSIARALAQETDIILMDEAFVNLDINHQLEIMNLLSKINLEHNKLILLVSHNINLASDYCDKLVFMQEGRIIAGGKPVEIVKPDILKQIYGKDIQTIINPISGRPNIIYPARHNEID